MFLSALAVNTMYWVQKVVCGSIYFKAYLVVILFNVVG